MGVVVLRGNCPTNRGSCPIGVIVLWVDVPRGSCHGGKWQRGSCPMGVIVPRVVALRVIVPTVVVLGVVVLGVVVLQHEALEITKLNYKASIVSSHHVPGLM